LDATAADVELQILTALPPHPNLVALLGSSRTDTHLLIQLELMHGSLDRLLARRAVFSEPEAFAILAQAAAGLAHVHSRGLLHRDVKLENLQIKPTIFDSMPVPFTLHYGKVGKIFIDIPILTIRVIVVD
jgi:serine/threonine protein kinase